MEVNLRAANMRPPNLRAPKCSLAEALNPGRLRIIKIIPLGMEFE